jgi:hypothetical protein
MSSSVIPPTPFPRPSLSVDSRIFTCGIHFTFYLTVYGFLCANTSGLVVDLLSQALASYRTAPVIDTFQHAASTFNSYRERWAT